MIRRVLRMQNELGLHARAAAKLVKLTSRFQSQVNLARLRNPQHIDGKSILAILLLAASSGTDLEVMVNGVDEEAAMEAIVDLVANRFGEGE